EHAPCQPAAAGPLPLKPSRSLNISRCRPAARGGGPARGCRVLGAVTETRQRSAASFRIAWTSTARADARDSASRSPRPRSRSGPQRGRRPLGACTLAWVRSLPPAPGLGGGLAARRDLPPVRSLGDGRAALLAIHALPRRELRHIPVRPRLDQRRRRASADPA